MTVSGSKSSCGMKVILSSRSMVDRRHVNNRSVKRKINRNRGVLRSSSSSIRWMKGCRSRRVGNCRNRRTLFFILTSSIYHLSSIYLSTIYLSSIINLSYNYHLSIMKLPNYHLSIFNLSSIYHLSIINLSSFCHLSTYTLRVNTKHQTDCIIK